MPGHVAPVEEGPRYLVQVEVRAADTRRGDADDHVIGLTDPRVGNRLHAHVVLALVGECPHDAPPRTPPVFTRVSSG